MSMISPPSSSSVAWEPEIVIVSAVIPGGSGPRKLSGPNQGRNFSFEAPASESASARWIAMLANCAFPPIWSQCAWLLKNRAREGGQFAHQGRDVTYSHPGVEQDRPIDSEDQIRPYIFGVVGLTDQVDARFDFINLEPILKNSRYRSQSQPNLRIELMLGQRFGLGLYAPSGEKPNRRYGIHSHDVTIRCIAGISPGALLHT